MHENAGSKAFLFDLIDIGLRLDFFQKLYQDLEANIVTFAYRGYTNSEGHLTEEGIKIDSHVCVLNSHKIFRQL